MSGQVLFRAATGSTTPHGDHAALPNARAGVCFAGHAAPERPPDEAFAAEIAPEKTKLVVRQMLHELTETVDAPTIFPFP